MGCLYWEFLFPDKTRKEKTHLAYSAGTLPAEICLKQVTSCLIKAFKQPFALFCNSPAKQGRCAEDGKEQNNACPLRASASQQTCPGVGNSWIVSSNYVRSYLKAQNVIWCWWLELFKVTVFKTQSLWEPCWLREKNARCFRYSRCREGIN